MAIQRAYCLLFCAVVSSYLVVSVECDVNAITRICSFDGCFDLDENDPKYSGTEYNRKLVKLFSSGISQLIFEHTQVDALTLDSSLSASCRDQLIKVSEAADHGYEWAFRFIDSSGKTPSAFLEGTVTSPGDYDECLAIQSPDSEINGQYCMVDVFPRAYKGNSKKVQSSGKISLATPRHFNASAYYFGLCFPSVCSTLDVKAVVKKVLEPYPLLVEGDLHCDTRDSISFLSRLKSIRIGPFISLIFLIALLAAVAWGTVSHLIYPNSATELQRSFSAFENAHRLFYVSSRALNRSEFLDLIKLIGIWSGVAAHVIICIESLIGVFVLSHIKNSGNLMSNPALIPLFNESGLVSMTFLSGAALFTATFTAAAQGRLRFLPVLLDRILRHLPGVGTIVAMDFVWYLWGSGPFWTRVGQYQVDKCSKTWWRSLLFIANLWGPSSEICAGHTYFSSVDVQLFVLGFVAIVLLASRPKLGVVYCVTLIVSSTGLMYKYGVEHELTPTLMVPRDPYIPKIEQFLIYIHMSTSGFVSSYFAAILVCYTISLGWWARFSHQINHLFWMGLYLSIHGFQQYMPLFTNTLDIVPVALTPLYIVAARVLSIVSMSIFIVYISLLEMSFSRGNKTRNNNLDSSANFVHQENSSSGRDAKSDGHYSLLKALLRLSFAVYLSNYYFIRTDFFTERSLFSNTLFALAKRMISSFFFVLITAFIFQILVLGPFTNLRVALISRLVKRKKVIEKGM